MNVSCLLQSERNKLVFEQVPIPFLLLGDVCAEPTVGVRPVPWGEGPRGSPLLFPDIPERRWRVWAMEGQLGDLMAEEEELLDLEGELSL